MGRHGRNEISLPSGVIIACTCCAGIFLDGPYWVGTEELGAVKSWHVLHISCSSLVLYLAFTEMDYSRADGAGQHQSAYDMLSRTLYILGWARHYCSYA